MQNNDHIPLMADSVPSNIVASSENDKNLSSEDDGSEVVTEHDFLVMLDKEKEYLVNDDYLMKLKNEILDSTIRRDSIDWMRRTNDYFLFKKKCFLMAVNYFDRFLSVHTFFRDQAWSMQLLAVASLSLALKMEEILLPSIVDLQVKEPRYFFEAKNIKKMELLVLGTLKWKMLACTPHTFVQYFVKMIVNDANYPISTLTGPAMCILVDTIEDVDFLEFKPSEIACAVALIVSGDLGEIDIVKELPNLKHIDKTRVVKCVKTIDGIILSSSSTTTTISPTTSEDLSRSTALSPDNVLEADCLSHKTDSEEEEVSVTSTYTEDYVSVDSKRRRLDGPSPFDED